MSHVIVLVSVLGGFIAGVGIGLLSFYRNAPRREDFDALIEARHWEGVAALTLATQVAIETMRLQVSALVPHHHPE